MNKQQILYAVEQGLVQFATEIENQIKYLTAILIFLEFDMRTIELYDGMDLDERIRYYELKEAIEDVQCKIANLKVHKPVVKFSKIDDSATGME
jgi:hypothetical protein